MRVGRFVVVLLALIGLFGQSVMPAMASTPSQIGAATQMMTMSAAECAQMAKTPHQRGDQSPCEKECLAKMGCGAASILATRSPMLSLTERYHDTAFFVPQSCLSGVEIEPEIFPPIA